MTDTPIPHLCHASGCSQAVPRHMFMCRKHWFMVPMALRNELWDAYVPGQEERMDPTPKYLDVAQRAIIAVQDREGII